MSKPRYIVNTWDPEREKYTPQDGVPEVVEGPAALNRALRQLRGMGYDVDRAFAHSVLVQREDDEA